MYMYMYNGWSTVCQNIIITLRDRVLAHYRVCLVDLLGLNVWCILLFDPVCLFVPALYHTF